MSLAHAAYYMRDNYIDVPHGNCVKLVESFTDTVRDGLQDLAHRATGQAHGDVTFETVSSVSRFPSYRPVAIPASELDRRCSPVEAAKNKTVLSKAPTS